MTILDILSIKIYIDNVSNEHGLMRSEMCSHNVINSLHAFKTF